MRKARMITMACVLGNLFVGSAQSSESVTLRLADYLPVGHYITRHATDYFMAEVTERTGGKVVFEYYPSQQLGKAKDLLALTQSGVTDIGLVVPSFVADKMPLSAVAELPAGFTNTCQGMKAYWQVGNGLLTEKEFAPNDVRMIFPVVIGPYQIFTKERELSGLSSFAGLKIYASGSAKDLATRSLGAVPIKMTTPEIYESVSRGTIDGMLLPYATVLAYDMQGLVKYATSGQSFAGASLNFMISEKKWQSLDEDVRQVISEVGEDTVDHACKLFDQDVANDLSKLQEAGVSLVDLSGSQQGEISTALESVATSWAENLDKQGKPGSEVLAAWRAALAQAGE